MSETNYWLRIIKEVNKNSEELNVLLNESNELKKILGSISSKTVKRNS